ncbi:streptomycin 6-kinase [Kribbella sp. VKM Ac-2527]|uniref:Streptomycin 6-kinase n=1 Tax=Kribbella caucasensis TaxID=2512215 RepID=A0A4R6K2F3_9ACTN|nr:aminoglycoside phosphotransferase family protein [Kribbella sp. VKM Ac-2527]TDO43329.1 streptomycin 6-kinase [Kribbella sp. VKM Ac-2527]
MIELPSSFLAMPRWWNEGEEWLTALPMAAQEQCERWDLRLDGELAHGSNAIVLPVRRHGEPLALRMSPPGRDVTEQIHALRWWDGRGMVRLLEADPDRGAMLLERLGSSLAEVPLDEAVGILGGLMRRLAVPADPMSLSTAEIVTERGAELERDWETSGRPFDVAWLREVEQLVPTLAITDGNLAVNGDIHADQVLRGTREPWLVVDPVLRRGDIEYDLARILWMSVDLVATGDELVEHFGTLVETAELDRDRARDWVMFRTVDYWLWGLNAGLTYDPVRCDRVVRLFL